MTTPAEQRAERNGLPVVAVIPFDLLRVAEGNPMIVTTVGGEEVLLRLATADEALRWNREAMEKHRPGGPLMTRTRAEELVRPLRLGGPS